jgi:pilus assembly protein CpaB
MNRSKRTAVVLGISIFLASVASLGVYRIVSRLPTAPAEMPTVDTVVARHPLQLGTRVTSDHVRIVKWPEASRIPGAFSKIEDVSQRGLISDLGENEPLTESKLAPLDAGAGLPPSIPPGMRAVSVKVNEVIGVAGFVVPGTRVDVMVTLTGRQHNTDSQTRVVVSNAQVLTAGTRYDQEKAKEGAPIPSTVVTLLVTPHDGERIALAASEGQIMLALRNPLDTTPTLTTGVRTAGLFGQLAPPAAPKAPLGQRARPVKAVQAPPAPVPATQIYSVEVIRNAKRTEEVVR